jgi:hypothetical protein
MHGSSCKNGPDCFVLHAATREQVDGVLRHLILRSPTKICRHIPILVKIGQNNGRYTWRPERRSDWVGNQQTALVIVVILVTMVPLVVIVALVMVTMLTMVTLVIMVTWGIFSRSDNSDLTGAIRKSQRSNSGELTRTAMLCVHLLTRLAECKIM